MIKNEFFVKNYVALVKYLKSVRSEMKRVTWPSWDELKASTTIVVLTLIVASIFVYAVDKLFVICFSLLGKNL